MSALEILKKQHSQYMQQRAKVHAQFQQVCGAIFGIEQAIKEITSPTPQKPSIPPEKSDAIEEGNQQTSDTTEHQDGYCSGQETEPSSSNSV